MKKKERKVGIQEGRKGMNKRNKLKRQKKKERNEKR